MSAFTDSAGVLATDPNLSVAGTLVSPTGSTVSARFLMARNDRRNELFETGVRNAGWTVSNLRKSEVPMRPDDRYRLVVAAGVYAGTYRVNEVEEDAEAETWTLHLSEAA